MPIAYRVGPKKNIRLVPLLRAELKRGNYGVVDRTEYELGLHSLVQIDKAFGKRYAEWLFPSKSAAKAAKGRITKVKLPKDSVLLFEDETGQLWMYP